MKLFRIGHDNTVTTRTDLVGRVVSMTDTAGNAAVTREYAYDSLARPVTRRTARQGNTVNDSFACNSRSELTAATVSGKTYGYSYDNIGNRKTAREDTEEATAYTTGPLNQYTAIERGEEAAFEPVYDADGNQTLIRTSTGIWQVAYNAENRPVRFVNESAKTVMECTYDYMGRRHTRKVSVNGTVSSYLRYMYRGYLQIAAIDAVSGVFRWFLFWDPTQPEAARPLAIRKDGTWYAYGWDLTGNVTEIFGKAGYLRTVYTYTPYGEVAAEGDVTQPIQWSSEYNDEELGLVYYNYRHHADGSIPNTEIKAVISNNKNAYALQRAKDHNIAAACVSPKDFADRAAFNQALLEKIKSYEPDLIVLAGCLVVVPEIMVDAYPNKIINIHPSLIPAFCGTGYYGLKVHEGVLKRGVKVTGATVHFVDKGTDTGPIIIQKAVEVQQDDTPEILQRRVMEQAEWKIMPQAIRLIAEGKVRVENGKTIITE